MMYDHKGNVYETLEDMCEAYNIKPETFTSRINRGWMLEEALLTPLMANYKDNPKIRTKEDAILKDERYFQYGKEATGESEDENPTVNRIRKRTKPGPKYIWTDHKGNVYPSKKAMCHAYGISAERFKSRTWDGWPMCYALEKGPSDYNFTDHQGNTYKYLSTMCRTYGIDKFEFQHRIDSGWSLEEALTLPSSAPKNKHYKSPCKKAF